MGVEQTPFFTFGVVCRAITTLHKDHYENLYGVVRGEKRFTLYPPTDLPLLYPRLYEPRVYRKEEGVWRTCMVESAHEGDREGHEWISVDPEAPDYERFPMSRYAQPIRISLQPGELLYLPCMWYHQVSLHLAATSLGSGHPPGAVCARRRSIGGAV